MTAGGPPGAPSLVRRTRWLSNALAAITTLILLAALAVAGYELLAQQRILAQINRESLWSSAQLNREYLALREAVAVHAVDPERVSANAVQRQVDLFWSRVPVIIDHDSGARTLGDPALTARLLVLRDALPEIDPLTEAFLADPDRDPGPLLDWLGRWEGAIQEALRLAIARDDTSTLVESLQRENQRGMMAALVALLMAFCLTGLMAQELRRTRSLQQAAERSGAAASAARDRLQAAIDAMDSGFVLVAEGDGLLLANQGALDLFPALAAVPESDRSAAGLARRLPHLPLTPGVTAHRLQDGRLVDAFVTKTEDGALLAVYRDVTDRERRERERDSLAAQLHQAQKQEALGRLAGGIAHDFNNVLGAIRGFADILVEDLGSDSELSPYAEQILQAADRAADLVQRILLFSRPHEGDPRAIDLTRVIGENVAMLRAGLSAAVRLEVEKPSDPLIAAVDPTQIGQVLVNLIVNARDAMGDRRGAIRVTAEAVTIDGGRAAGLLQEGSTPDAALKIVDGPDGTIQGWFGILPARGGHARITVSDEGSGMDRATVERMFDPFFTTKEAGRGTGLGLSTVQGIVLAHRGALTLETKAGAFTRIAILLPLGTEPVPVDLAPTASAARAAPDERLLLVDDEAAVAEPIAIGLRRRGWSVETVDGAAAALALLDTRPRDWFSLIVTDQTMPGMSGADLIGEVGLRYPHLPVVLCTGHGQIGTGEAAKAVGAAAFLRKPLAADRLAATIRQILDAATGAADTGLPPVRPLGLPVDDGSTGRRADAPALEVE